MGAVIVLLVFNIIGYVLFRNVEIKERVQYAQEQPPRQYGLFTALVGSGVHLSVSLILLLLISLFGVYHSTTESGHAFRFLYNVTSYIQGFISTKLYCTYYRIKWIRHAVYTHFLVPMIVTGFLIARNLGLLFTDNDFITLTTNGTCNLSRCVCMYRNVTNDNPRLVYR
jgi:hypothetical protein